MSCLRDLDSISSLSLLGMVCLVAGVVAILYHGFQDFGEAAYKELWSLEERADEPSVALWPESVAGASAFLGVTIFCFDICSLAFPIEESMRHKAEFSRAVVWALLCVWAVYVLLGDVGAALYVHDPDGGIGENILSNLPVNSTIALMVRWAMACVSLKLHFPT
jgi:amino acid permease